MTEQKMKLSDLNELSDFRSAYLMITGLLKLAQKSETDIFNVKIAVSDNGNSQQLSFVWKRHQYLEFLKADQLRLLKEIESFGLNVDDEIFFNNKIETKQEAQDIPQDEIEE